MYLDALLWKPIILDWILNWFFKTKTNKTKPRTNILILSFFMCMIYCSDLLFVGFFNPTY